MSEDSKVTSFSARMDAAARDIILDALKKAGGNRKTAATALGVNRTHMYVLMERYKVEFAAPPRPVKSRVAEAQPIKRKGRKPKAKSAGADITW